MTIAIPVSQERISPVLDTAARLLLVKRRRGKEIERKEIVLSPMPATALAACIAELRADVLLCAAVSEDLLAALEKKGVRVKYHLCGEVDVVLNAFCRRQLCRDEFRMPGCWGLHSHGGCCRRGRRSKNGTSGSKSFTEQK